MNEEILINITPQETRVALIQQGAVQELQIERTRQRGIVGNIYLAKVARVLPGMQSAFIEIGLERTAFMHVADILQNHSQTQIEKLLFEGQTLLVQVLKDPLGTKGARLTTQLSIAGRNLVYLPPNSNDPSTEKYIGISQRIEEPEEREAIKNRLAGLMLSMKRVELLCVRVHKRLAIASYSTICIICGPPGRIFLRPLKSNRRPPYSIKILVSQSAFSEIWLARRRPRFG